MAAQAGTHGLDGAENRLPTLLLGLVRWYAGNASGAIHQGYIERLGIRANAVRCASHALHHARAERTFLSLTCHRGAHCPQGLLARRQFCQACSLSFRLVSMRRFHAHLRLGFPPGPRVASFRAQVCGCQLALESVFSSHVLPRSRVTIGSNAMRCAVHFSRQKTGFSTSVGSMGMLSAC